MKFFSKTIKVGLFLSLIFLVSLNSCKEVIVDPVCSQDTYSVLIQKQAKPPVEYHDFELYVTFYDCEDKPISRPQTIGGFPYTKRVSIPKSSEKFVVADVPIPQGYELVCGNQYMVVVHDSSSTSVNRRHDFYLTFIKNDSAVYQSPSDFGKPTGWSNYLTEYNFVWTH